MSIFFLCEISTFLWNNINLIFTILLYCFCSIIILGESASVLIEKQRRLEENEELDETQEGDNERKIEENLLNNKEFYQQMMVSTNNLFWEF